MQTDFFNTKGNSKTVERIHLKMHIKLNKGQDGCS